MDLILAVVLEDVQCSVLAKVSLWFLIRGWSEGQLQEGTGPVFSGTLVIL